MTRSFKELGKKAETLIEKGREAEQRVQLYESRVVALRQNVIAAKRQLAAASEIDEEGNPVGDVLEASAELLVAENRLNVGLSELALAKRDAERVKQLKNEHVLQIKEHVQIERSNVDRLSKLRDLAFADDSSELIEGIVKRLNEAEDIKVALQRSMGINTTADYLTISSTNKANSMWENHRNSQTGAFQQGYSVWEPQKTDAPKNDENVTLISNTIPSNSGANEADAKIESTGVSTIQSEQENKESTSQDLSRDWSLSFDTFRLKHSILIKQIIESDTLTSEQKKLELNSIKRKLGILADQISNQVEADEIKEFVKKRVLKLDPEKKRLMGEQYIDGILEVHKNNLLNRGVTSSYAIDVVLNELREYYEEELGKDMLGFPNGLYKDIDYSKLIEATNKYRPPIADVFPGDDMTFEQADSGHVNPNYGEDYGYSTNCPACVVAFEARQRGYDVQALPLKSDPVFDQISVDPRIAWVDPKTGKHPEYIYDTKRRTPEEYLDFINKTVKQGNRFTIHFIWKGRNYSGHIVNIDRTEKGLLRIKDNQRGSEEKSVWIGDVAVLEYLSNLRYVDEPNGTYPCVPFLLRIDNMDFDYSVVNHIVKGTGNDTFFSHEIRK